MTQLLSPIDPWHERNHPRDPEPKLVQPAFGSPYITSENHRTWRVDFRSIRDLYDTMTEAGIGKRKYKTSGGTKVVTNPFEATSWEQVAPKLQHWPEGAELLHRRMKATMSFISRLVETPRPVYDVFGEEYDIGAYMTGEPEHWLAEEKRISRGIDREGPIRLVIQHAISTGADMSRLIARGAMALTLATIFERHGRPTEIVAADAGRWHRGGRQYDLFWTSLVKPMARPLNLSTMAFAIASPLMERSIYLIGAADIDKRTCKFHGLPDSDGNCGAPLNVPCGDKRDTITIDYIPDYVSLAKGNEDKTREYLLGTLKAQGIHVKGV